MRTLIVGGLVYDGTGAAPVRLDLLLEDGRIAKIGRGLTAEGAVVVDAAGLAVTPGFVDMHRHCDTAPMTDKSFGLLELAQGITTTVVGNCGLAPVPVSPASKDAYADFLAPIIGPGPLFQGYREYFAALRAAKPPLHIGVLAGAGAIRTCVMGFRDAPYTHALLDEAAGYTRAAMEEGALGVSLGIMYQPECYSTVNEMAAVVRPAAKAGGVLAAHIRGEGDSLVESVEEILKVANAAGIRLHISHFKSTGIHNWRVKIYGAIEKIEDARARGLVVTADFYPYDGGATTLLSLLPPCVLQDGGEATLRHLATAGGKEQLRREVYKSHPGWDNMAKSIGWERILISGTSLPEHAGYGGRNIAELTAASGYAEPADFVADLCVAEKGKVGIIVRSMCPEDVDTVACLPYTAVISDALYGGGDSPHPRLYGAFPRVIRDFVCERSVLSMQQAVYKMTGLPASILGLREQGRLAPGYRADLNLFDSALLRDNASYTDPKRLSTGMAAVYLAGRLVYRDGGGMLPGTGGEVLRRE